MFIDVRATRLNDNYAVVNLLKMIENRQMGNLDRRSNRSHLVSVLRSAFLEHYTCRTDTDIINYELEAHLALGVSRSQANVKSINGTFRERFSHHNQLHISNDLAVISIAQKKHSVTVGLLIPNSEARNPLYFSHANMFDFLNGKSQLGVDPAQVLNLLSKVKILLKKPAPDFRHDDARVCIMFIRGAMGLLQDNLVHPITPTTKLAIPTGITELLGRKHYHVLYPYVVKVYLEICKRDGNYALGTHQLWQ